MSSPNRRTLGFTECGYFIDGEQCLSSPSVYSERVGRNASGKMKGEDYV